MGINKGKNIPRTIKRYSVATLPPQTNLAPGATVIVEGTPQVVSNGELVAVRNNNANSFAVVGDSYSANLIQFSSDLHIRCNNYSYIFHALGLCGRRMKITSFNAVGGTGFLKHTPTFGAQLTNAIASGAKNLVFMGGFNDVYSDEYQINDIINAAKVFFKRVKMAGMRLFLCTQPGPSSGVWNYSYNRTGKMQQLQEFYRQYAAQSSSTDVILVDCAAVATDPTSPSMSYKAGYVTSDNVHPTNLGSYVMGKLLASKIVEVLPPAEELSSSNYATYSYNSNCKNMLSNGLFLDGVSGAPTGWSIINDSGVVTGTKTSTPRADGFGNDLVIPITSISTAGNGVTVENSVGVTAGVADGDEFYLELECSLIGAVQMRGFWIRLNIESTTAGRSWFAGYWQGASGIPDGDHTYQFRSPNLKYNAATMGALTGGLKTYIKAVGDTATSSCSAFKIGRVSIKKVIP